MDQRPDGQNDREDQRPDEQNDREDQQTYTWKAILDYQMTGMLEQNTDQNPIVNQ